MHGHQKVHPLFCLQNNRGYYCSYLVLTCLTPSPPVKGLGKEHLVLLYVHFSPSCLYKSSICKEARRATFLLVLTPSPKGTGLVKKPPSVRGVHVACAPLLVLTPCRALTFLLRRSTKCTALTPKEYVSTSTKCSCVPLRAKGKGTQRHDKKVAREVLLY